MKNTVSRIAMIAVTTSLFALAVPSFAKEHVKPAGHGKITAVSATSITVTPKDGVAKTFTINDSTKVKIDKEPAKVSDLVVGERAGVRSDDGTIATEINAHTKKAKKAADASAVPAIP